MVLTCQSIEKEGRNERGGERKREIESGGVSGCCNNLMMLERREEREAVAAQWRLRLSQLGMDRKRERERANGTLAEEEE